MNKDLHGVEASEIQVERETIDNTESWRSKTHEEVKRGKIKGSFGFRLAVHQKISFRQEEGGKEQMKVILPTGE